MCEPAPQTVINTRIFLQPSPNKVTKTSQEPDHDLLSNLGITDHQWMAWVAPDPLALEYISKEDPSLQLIKWNTKYSIKKFQSYIPAKANRSFSLDVAFFFSQSSNGYQ